MAARMSVSQLNDSASLDHRIDPFRQDPFTGISRIRMPGTASAVTP